MMTQILFFFFFGEMTQADSSSTQWFISHSWENFKLYICHYSIAFLTAHTHLYKFDVSFSEGHSTLLRKLDW